MRCAGAWLLACACACALVAAARAQQHNYLGPGVCQTLDIRNGPESFEKLRNCSVVEGSVSIVLMERSNYSYFQGISFPKLREITGFLIMYRVKGLRSLGQLFPNLAVIRGQVLFKDFALVLFDNEDLQTVGLSSLTNIERGAVRIERNNKLCYVDSINWGLIAPRSDNNNVITSNNFPPQCGLCPGEADATGTAKQCPKNSYGQHLCWDANTCQKVCPAECGSRACMSDGTCCDPNCLGGCTGARAEDCLVCRSFSIGYGADRRCAGICPPQTYKHYNRRCVSEEECRHMASPIDSDQRREVSPTAKNLSYKPFNDTCTFDCPLGYVEVIQNRLPTCQRCEGVCIKYCSYDRIDSLESAQKFRGCTHLTGSLDISIRGGGNVMEELETCLGMVQEIEGLLKVSRSYALVTLSFFKSLRRIRGKTTASSNGPRQSLNVFDNPNLEELWDWKKHGNITIDEGNLFIHFNPKLCYDQIRPLRYMAKQSKFDDVEVSTQTNGDKAACSREEIQMRVRTITVTAVVLEWDQYCLPDQRQLLGYSVYYTKAPHNVTLYEKRNACQDIWQVEDLSNEAMYNSSQPIQKNMRKLESYQTLCKQMQPLFHLLPRLEPYTRYAAYVKTYTTQADSKGAQSPIIYFVTLPGQPKPPRLVSIDSGSPNEMTIKWQRPIIPNGNITSYHILLELEEDHHSQAQRDYCAQPPPVVTSLRPKEEEERRARKRAEERAREAAERAACSCDDGGRSASIFSDDRQAEHDEAIQFENDLQNAVYVKNAKDRPRRSAVPISSNDTSELDEPPPEKNITEGGYYRVLSVMRSWNVTELQVSRLRHYAQYRVSVWACRELHYTELVNRTVANCSSSATKSVRTPMLERADAVGKVFAEVLPGNKSTPGVRVSWSPPAAPNGPVLAYNIKHSRVENDQIMQTATTCVSAEEFSSLGQGYNLRNLAPGNYSITVNAVTLAGNGPLSEKASVFIPERPTEAPREWVVGVVAGCLVAFALLAGGVWYARRGLMPPSDNNKLFATVNPEYVGTVYVPDEWEVPRGNIELVRELGQGSFGMVYEGIAKDINKDTPEMRCAVKTVNEHATDRERVEFLNEASVMKAFDTHHVVRLLGVVSRGQPTLVIMELMERGDLKSYLRSHRPEQDNSQPTSTQHGSAPKQPPTLQQIKQMAIEIADGMSYLAAKKFVHRDLAARNCMVAGDLTVKVGDFGMTRDIYETDYYRKGSKGLMPVRWMSPESLKDGVFSSSSDVWSFGVVIWEMATLAMQPYQGLSNEQVLRYVVEGGVMERPEHCPDALYELMRRCWAHRPSLRPSFTQIVAELAPIAAPSFRHRSFFHSPGGQEYYAHQQNQEEEEQVEVQVGAMAEDSASNLFGVSGRLASWVRDLSGPLRSRSDDDAATEPLAPHVPLKPATIAGPNGVVSARYSREPAFTSNC